MQDQTVYAEDGTPVLLEYDGTYSYACRGSSPDCGLRVDRSPHVLGRSLDSHCSDWHGGVRLPVAAAELQA